MLCVIVTISSLPFFLCVLITITSPYKNGPKFARLYLTYSKIRGRSGIGTKLIESCYFQYYFITSYVVCIDSKRYPTNIKLWRSEGHGEESCDHLRMLNPIMGAAILIFFASQTTGFAFL